MPRQRIPDVSEKGAIRIEARGESEGIQEEPGPHTTDFKGLVWSPMVEKRCVRLETASETTLMGPTKVPSSAYQQLKKRESQEEMK